MSQFMHKPTEEHWHAFKRYYNISWGLNLKESSSISLTRLLFMPSRTPIGLVIKTAIPPPVHTLSTMANIPLLGHRKSKKALHDCRPKQNTMPLQTHLLKFVGSRLYYQNWESRPRQHHQSTATILEQLTLP